MIRAIFKLVISVAVLTALIVVTAVLLEQRPELRREITRRLEAVVENVATALPAPSQQEPTVATKPQPKATRDYPATPALNPDGAAAPSSTIPPTVTLPETIGEAVGLPLPPKAGVSERERLMQTLDKLRWTRATLSEWR